MNRWMKVAGVVAVMATAAGCARLQVYKNENLEGPETGFRFYVSKPYVLVSFTNNPADALEISVVHIPDLATPYYVKPQPGLLGNSNLSMNFSSGVMTSFGQQTESGVTGLLDSVGGLRKALAEASKLGREARTLAAAAAAPESADKKSKNHADAAARLQVILSGMRLYASSPRLTPLERQNVESYAGVIGDAMAKLRDAQNSERNLPGVLVMLEQMLTRWDSQIPGPASSDDIARQNLGESKRQVAEVFLDLAPKPPEMPPFLLYEIVSKGGVTSLKPVRFGH